MGRRPGWFQLVLARSGAMLDVATCRACLLVDSTTMLMASLASIAIDLLADPDGTYSPKRVLLGTLWIVAAITMRIQVGRANACSSPAIGKHPALSGRERSTPQHQPAPILSIWWVAGLTAVTVAPLAIEPILRMWLGEGRPLEIQMLLGLRNLALALAALSLWPHCARLSAAASLCLMLFAQVVDEGKSSTWLLLPFAVAGGFWLLVSYQASFATLVTAEGESRAIRVHSSFRALWRGLAYLTFLVLGLAGVWAIGPRTRALAPGEWFGSSGGTGENDPFARGGVNDGQEEVGGENPETTGFAETDKFLESEKPTLYDAASDLYGEPVRKRKKQLERMISVTPSEIREIKNHAESKRASREFSTARKGPKRPRNRPEDREARALFEVQGRTPLHLRMDVLVEYDGATWTALANDATSHRIENAGVGTEMHVVAPQLADCYGPSERHKVKIASISGALAPTPTLLSQFRVGLIDRADFFEWRRDGVLAFKGRSTIPSGTTIQTECRTANLESLEGGEISGDLQAALTIYRDLPQTSREIYQEIGQRWAGHHPRGAAQVAAIIQRLRDEYQCNQAASVATTEGDPTLHFLQVQKSGPDYLFASSTVLLLRSQGYSARLALGYYASPAAFDRWTRHTPVQETDMHFWPEILLTDGTWLALEPTPGYEVLLPQPTLAERVANAGLWLTEFSMRHPLAVSAILFSLILTAVYRREIADALRVVQIRLRRPRNWRERVLASMRLIESRASAVRHGRAPHQSLLAWSSQYLDDAQDAMALQMLVGLAQVATYGPPQKSMDYEAICRNAEQTWTIKRFRQSVRPRGMSTPQVIVQLEHSSRLVAN